MIQIYNTNVSYFKYKRVKYLKKKSKYLPKQFAGTCER